MSAKAKIDPMILCNTLHSRSKKDGTTYSGVSHGDGRRRNPKKLDLEELIRAAARAAHHARDKGLYTVSPEALRCVEILNQIKGLRVAAQVISESNTIPTVLFLSKNGNPKIRSEARSLLDHWKNILSTKRGDHVKNGDREVSCLTRKTGIKKYVSTKPYSTVKNDDPQNSSRPLMNGNSYPCDRQLSEANTQNKTSFGRQELLELFEAAKEAAKAVKRGDSSSAEASRCINRLKQLSKLPWTLTRDVILTTDSGSRLYSLTEHSNPDISCAANSLLNLWRVILFTTGRNRRG